MPQPPYYSARAFNLNIYEAATDQKVAQTKITIVNQQKLKHNNQKNLK